MKHKKERQSVWSRGFHSDIAFEHVNKLAVPSSKFEYMEFVVIAFSVLTVSWLVTIIFFEWLKFKKRKLDPDHVEIDYDIFIWADDERNVL